ncbi:MAG: PepSY domain-containing protein [Sneathiella sp.]|nr:PepSY domain-containing protein [Sneathiella sp.]
MKHVMLASAAIAFLALFSTSANAEENRCNAPMAEWQPREALQQKLEAEGWKVKRIKVEDGCYEAYAIDNGGKRIEAYFNPKLLKMLQDKTDD